MKHPFPLLLLTVTMFTATAFAQLKPGQIYLRDNTTEVYIGTKQKQMAWCGGTNNPQISVADLDKDGIRDLIIFDKGAPVKTFLNKSSVPGSPKYVYHPEFAANFPDIVDYLKLEDFNRDNIPDLFHRGYEGITPFRGYYNSSNQLCFAPTNFKGFQGLRYALPGSGMVNAYVSPSDIPGFADLDKDGDLDFCAYDVSGSALYYYRNCQVEDGLPNDSITICVKDVCWGKTQQGIIRTYLLNKSCPPYGTTCKGCGTGEKTTHSGNTVCLLDYDGDGDFDMLDGNISFSDLQYLKNGKVEYSKTIDSMVAQDTLWGGNNGKVLQMAQFPVAFWVDVDNDNDKDIVVSPHADNTENYKCLAYYQNTGTNASPNFSYRMDTLFIEDMIDVGTASAPFFYDYNKDGKTDLLVGSDGYYQSNGSLKTRVSYYQNASTTTTTKLEYRTNNLLQMDSMSLNGAVLAAGDLDGDGKDELVVGKTDGTLMVYKNNAVSGSVQPDWYQPTPLRDASSAIINVGGFAAPCIYDLDKDGKKDLVIGCQLGKLYYYRNLGSILGAPSLQKMTDTLGGISIREYGNVYSYTVPYIGRIDDQTKEYLMIGTKSGIIYRYDGFATGSIKGYNRLDSGYCDVRVGDRAVPTFTDLDGDGKYDMVVGNTLGGLSFYKQFFNVGIAEAAGNNNQGIKVYPNPAKESINISWSATFAKGDIQVTLVSITGQRLWSATVQGSMLTTQINTADLPAGMYYCLLHSESNQAATPVSIVK